MRTKLILVLAVASMCFPGCSPRGEPASAGAAGLPAKAPAFVAADFDGLVGAKAWKGTLEYLDYTSGKLTTIRSSLLVQRAPAAGADPAWSVALGYDDEPKADSASLLTMLEGGAAIRSGDSVERVISRHMDGDICDVMTESRGQDDNKPATIRRAFRFGKGEFAIRKLVKFEGAAEFIKRHEYRWTRE